MSGSEEEDAGAPPMMHEDDDCNYWWDAKHTIPVEMKKGGGAVIPVEMKKGGGAVPRLASRGHVWAGGLEVLPRYYSARQQFPGR